MVTKVTTALLINADVDNYIVYIYRGNVTQSYILTLLRSIYTVLLVD